MSDQVYKDMIDVMNERSAIFGGMDIPEFYPLVEELFSPEEAEINNAMPAKGTFTAADLAEKMGKDAGELATTLKDMADKGLCISFERDGERVFRAAPFMPGIFEFVFFRGSNTDRDKKLARLVHEYKEAWQANSPPLTLPYPMIRVITVEKTIEAGEKIHTYDQMKKYIEQNDTIAVGICYCRQEAMLLGEDTHGMPMDACVFFGNNAKFGIDCLGAKKVTQEEALRLLDEWEEAGLIHQTRNVSDEIEYLCNCDRYHCNAVKLMLAQPNPAKVFNSGFEPKFDADACVACETCIDRCPLEALTMGDDDVPQVDLDKCCGCAVCATGCPSEAITMVAKADFEAPPKDQDALMLAMMTAMANQG
jgi:Pyruvate/2-oxoacid:ferredoxin oxidoreductase delta subunit